MGCRKINRQYSWWPYKYILSFRNNLRVIYILFWLILSFIYVYRFPSQQELQPTLANGHVGFTVFDDSVYLNGLFNGQLGLSHRARLPNWAMIRMGPASAGCGVALDCRSEFRLNIHLGTFEEERTYGNRFRVVHRVYAHRFHNRAIINEFRIYRHSFRGKLQIHLIWIIFKKHRVSCVYITFFLYHFVYSLFRLKRKQTMKKGHLTLCGHWRNLIEIILNNEYF